MFKIQERRLAFWRVRASALRCCQPFHHVTTKKSAFMHSLLTEWYGLSGCRRSGGMTSTRPKTPGSVVCILSRLILMWLSGGWEGWRRELYQFTFRGMGTNYQHPERASRNGVRGPRVPPQSQTRTRRLKREQAIWLTRTKLYITRLQSYNSSWKSSNFANVLA